MKAGVNLINYGAGTTPEALFQWAHLAEELGYHVVALSDHVAVTPDVQTQYPAPFYDPFISLAWLAGKTTRIGLGTTVAVLPYRNPLEVARMGANLDRLSGGRFIFGVGVGWASQEFEALDVAFDTRGAMADDYLAAIKALWTHDVTSYCGPFLSFHDVHTGPRPIQSPHPPIWVGGASDAALRRAVRLGDGWHPIRIRVDWLENEGLPRLKRIADAEQRKLPAVCPRIMLHLNESPLPNDQRVAGQGTLDQIHRDLEALQSLGADCVVLDTYNGNPETLCNHEPAWRALAVLAEQVLDLPGESVR